MPDAILRSGIFCFGEGHTVCAPTVALETLESTDTEFEGCRSKVRTVADSPQPLSFDQSASPP